MTKGSDDALFMLPVNEIERKAAVMNINTRGRRRLGMGTVTRRAWDDTLSLVPYRNVPEWCAHRFHDSGAVPPDGWCRQIFSDTMPAPFDTAADMGRTDICKIHDNARYAECVECVMCIGGVYKGAYMLNIIRHAHKLSRGSKGNLPGINRMRDMINADYEFLCTMDKTGSKMNPNACFWKCTYKEK